MRLRASARRVQHGAVCRTGNPWCAGCRRSTLPSTQTTACLAVFPWCPPTTLLNADVSAGGLHSAFFYGVVWTSGLGSTVSLALARPVRVPVCTAWRKWAYPEMGCGRDGGRPRQRNSCGNRGVSGLGLPHAGVYLHLRQALFYKRWKLSPCGLSDAESIPMMASNTGTDCFNFSSASRNGAKHSSSWV